MNKLVALLLIVLTFLPCTGFAQDQKQVDPQKEALIKEILETTGSLNLGRQMMARMVEVEKVGKTEEQKRKIDFFAARMDPAEMVDVIVGIYDRHFSSEELRDILRFYKSETGTRMLKKMPLLLQESMDAGAEWARRKGLELQEELESGTSLQRNAILSHLPNNSFKPRPLRGSACVLACSTPPFRAAVRLNSGVRCHVQANRAHASAHHRSIGGYRLFVLRAARKAEPETNFQREQQLGHCLSNRNLQYSARGE